jgi:hypothetical protein
MIFCLFCVGVVILNTNVDGDHRSGALSPDNIQVIGTASGNIIIDASYLLTLFMSLLP